MPRLTRAAAISRVAAMTIVLAAAIVPLAAAQPADDAPPSLDKVVDWQRGPCSVAIGSIASMKIPQGFRALNAENTQKLMELFQNPVTGKELALVADDKVDWFFVFEFDECGYVKDDDKGNLDAREHQGRQRARQRRACQARLGSARSASKHLHPHLQPVSRARMAESEAAD